MSKSRTRVVLTDTHCSSSVRRRSRRSHHDRCSSSAPRKYSDLCCYTGTGRHDMLRSRNISKG